MLHRAKIGLCIKPRVHLEDSRRLSALAMAPSQLEDSFSLVKHPVFLPAPIPKTYTLASSKSG
jgi:hypothetical protein